MITRLPDKHIDRAESTFSVFPQVTACPRGDWLTYDTHRRVPDSVLTWANDGQRARPLANGAALERRAQVRRFSSEQPLIQ